MIDFRPLNLDNIDTACNFVIECEDENPVAHGVDAWPILPVKRHGVYRYPYLPPNDEWVDPRPQDAEDLMIAMLDGEFEAEDEAL